MSIERVFVLSKILFLTNVENSSETRLFWGEVLDVEDLSKGKNTNIVVVYESLRKVNRFLKQFVSSFVQGRCVSSRGLSHDQHKHLITTEKLGKGVRHDTS